MPSLDLMAHLAIETLRISVPTIIDASFGLVSSEVCDQRLDSWSRSLLRDAGVHLEVHGRQHLVPDEGYLVMSNHQSHYDIPVLFQALRIPMRMVAKKELFRIPFLSGAMRAAGFVELDRQRQRVAIETLITAREALSPSMSIWISPEGTRSRNGRLGPFKRGGFRMAIDNRLRILPVTINGTQWVLPAGELTVRRGKIARVDIGAPINAADYGRQNMNDLITTVRRAIENNLSEPSRVLAPHAEPLGEYKCPA
jgi:1-acyl-sn-glycerol-3-phosphate acyltransferase